jgi:hypothetical protein
MNKIYGYQVSSFTGRISQECWRSRWILLSGTVFEPLLKLKFLFVLCVTTRLERHTDVEVEAIAHHIIGPIVFQLTTLSIFMNLLTKFTSCKPSADGQ